VSRCWRVLFIFLRRIHSLALSLVAAVLK